MDRCEELAAAWGVLPQVVLQMPSVHVRILWHSYSKRQRRQLKWEAQLAGVQMGYQMISSLGSAPAGDDWNKGMAEAAAFGYPVKTR